MKEPARPKSLPKTATWDKKESCWTAVALDAKGKKHGRAEHWYPSGSPRGETDFEKGVEHGIEHTVRGGPGEWPFGEDFDERVHELFSTLDRGMLVHQRCVDAKGNPVGFDGKPLPPRPKNVPAHATWIAPLSLWVEGPLEGAKPIKGEQRRYSRDGRLLADLRYEVAQYGPRRGGLHRRKPDRGSLLRRGRSARSAAPTPRGLGRGHETAGPGGLRGQRRLRSRSCYLLR
ncbi:MAG: hypothetical protein EOP08_04930 [Proteobacteria bacterium]|nr:MAG: hypothetical protein EOP08_04930 [Pseudomonadota bacterium]